MGGESGRAKNTLFSVCSSHIDPFIWLLGVRAMGVHKGALLESMEVLYDLTIGYLDPVSYDPTQHLL